MMQSTWEDASERTAGVEWVRAVRRDLAPTVTTAARISI